MSVFGYLPKWSDVVATICVHMSGVLVLRSFFAIAVNLNLCQYISVWSDVFAVAAISEPM